MISLSDASVHPDYAALDQIPEITLRLRYATPENFVGIRLYDPGVRPLLHHLAAGQLREAAAFLEMEQPGAKLVIWDALRPQAVQVTMWKHVTGTPLEKYVADPKRRSIHSFGFAVDLTVAGRDGQALDMGTDYDDFRPLAEPARESHFSASGALSPRQLENRRLLRRVMIRAGFEPLATEWWHFDARPAHVVRKHYQAVE